MGHDGSKQFCRRTRRWFLWETGAGLTGLGLASMLDRDGFLGNQAVAANGSTPYKNPLEPKDGHLPAKAKAVIFLYMYGGPSHVDTFEMKPKLGPLDGKTIDIKTFGRGGHRKKGRVVGPQWNSNSMASVANGSRICFRIWEAASTTCRSSTRCTPSRPFTALRC